MAYIQCKDENEAEKVLQKFGTGFYTEDHRVYDTMRLGDKECWYDLNCETVYHLFELQTSIEMLTDGSWETSFIQIAEDAKHLSEKYKAALEAVKFKPIVRKKK